MAHLCKRSILALDDAVTQVPKKFYVAYKVTQNFVCMELKKSKVILFLKLNPTTLRPLSENARDVTNIGHSGTGDLEYTIASAKQLETAYVLIKQAFENVGGLAIVASKTSKGTFMIHNHISHKASQDAVTLLNAQFEHSRGGI